MALAYKAGEFTANTATGNQSITGVGFIPKVLRIMIVTATADGEANPGNLGIGITDFTNSRSITVAVNDNVNPSAVQGATTTNFINIFLNANTPSGTQDGTASIVSADADGFTINWSVACSSAWKVFYEAWGGSDITNVKVGTWNPSSGTGSKSLTGLGFQPNALLWLCGGNTSISVGASSGAGQGFSAGMDDVAGNTTTPNSRYFHDAVSINSGAGGSTVQKASLTSFDSDGFTYNFTTRANTTTSLYYIAIKGGNWLTGNDTTPTATGTKQTSGIGFQPVGVSIFGIFQPTTTALTSGTPFFSLGGGNGVSSNSYAAGASWSSANTQRSASGINPKIIYAPVGTAATLAMVADLTAWDSNSFTLNYTTVQGTARQFGYLAAGTSSQLFTQSIAPTQGQGTATGHAVAKLMQF